MKIDRRSFLSFVVGGAAGTALTPIPWKLTDDSSIWSQMWPWTPVPAGGEVTFADTVCSLCPGGCGITVRKVGDRAVKIEGQTDHPVNDGGICPLGLSGLQLLYGPTRVKAPLKRVGNRGSGQWEKISWDAAIEEVAKNLNDLKAAGKANEVACLAESDRGTVAGLIKRFLQAYGSPNFVKMPASSDAYELAVKKMHGVAATAGFDVENADFVISFGSGVIQGWGAPVRMIKANSAWKETGATFTQVEPRKSITAAKADKWLPIKPGTETTLALGLAHLIVKHHPHQAFDTTALDAALEAYYPTKVAEETGIDEDVIIELASAFARAEKPLALYGKGRGSTPGSVGDAMAVHTLNALVGNINKMGGVWLVDGNETVAWPEFTPAAGADGERVDGAGSGPFTESLHLPSRLIQAVLTDNYPLQALFVANANPLYSLSDSQAVQKAFAKIPYLVSFSSYMDETAAYADLILPNHHYLERLEDIPSPAGYPEKMVLLARPAVEPQFNTMHTGDVILQLAGAVGGSVAEAFAWENYDACLQEVLGDVWDTLDEQGYVVNEGSALATDPAAVNFAGLDAGPVAMEGGTDYPLVFIPYDSLRLSSGYIGGTPFMIKTVEDTILKEKDSLVEINPATAKKAGLREGDTAVIETPRGRARVRVHLYDGIRPGVVAMPRGLGHTAYDKYLAGKGINVNALIGPVEDPASGLDAAWGIRAKLSKA